MIPFKMIYNMSMLRHLIGSQLNSYSVKCADVNKYICPAGLSAGCEHGLAGREKHKAVKCTNLKCPFIHQN